MKAGRWRSRPATGRPGSSWASPAVKPVSGHDGRGARRGGGLAGPVAGLPGQRPGAARPVQRRRGARRGGQDRRQERPPAELHRNLSLFAVALLVLHVATALLDPYVSIGWLASVVPFASRYDRAAIGLGAIAADIGGAVLVTSVLRRRLGLRAWKVIHYLAYLAWPAAFLHAITAAGYDRHVWWVAGIEWAALVAVATAVIARLLARLRPERDGAAPAGAAGRAGMASRAGQAPGPRPRAAAASADHGERHAG